MTEAEIELLQWERREHRRRSRLLTRGKGKIDWLNPGTRVSWSEVWHRAQELGIKRDLISMRVWFHENKLR